MLLKYIILVSNFTLVMIYGQTDGKYFKHNIGIDLEIAPIGRDIFVGEANDYVKNNAAWDGGVCLVYNEFFLAFSNRISTGEILKTMDASNRWIIGNIINVSDRNLSVGYVFLKKKTF